MKSTDTSNQKPAEHEQQIVLPLYLVVMNTGVAVRTADHNCIARLKYDERCEDQQRRNEITTEIVRSSMKVFHDEVESPKWLDRLSEVLGCDQCWSSISVAAQELQDERDRMLKTIAELRAKLSK